VASGVPLRCWFTGNILMWRLSGKCGEITPQICQARNFAAMITAAQGRSARTLLGWSLNKLARAASVPADVIDNFEMERQRPDAATIGALQRAFEDVGVEFLPDDDVRIRAATPPDS
jgi:ribosome-binding protein aMBF1 (putative translation factor)